MFGLRRKSLLLPLLVATLTLLSCAIGTSVLKVGYQGDLPESPGLKDLPSMVFVVSSFEDDRSRLDRVANKKNTYGMTMGKAVTDMDVRDIIQDAITKELERYHHKTYASGIPSDALIIIDGTLTEFWVEPTAKLFTVETVASVRANVVLKNANTSDILMSRNFSGLYSSEKAAAWTGTWEDHLNKALKNFVANLTTSGEFLEACNKVIPINQ